MSATKLATRYACAYDGQEIAGHLHTRGTGKPQRTACRYCTRRAYPETTVRTVDRKPARTPRRFAGLVRRSAADYPLAEQTGPDVRARARC